MYRFGIGITVIWAVVCIYLALTAKEMEILIPLVLFIVGGYIIVSYFLIVTALKQKSVKRKVILLGIAFLWMMIPVFNKGLNAWQRHQHEVQLERTYPSKELVEEVFSEFDNKYLRLRSSSYENEELVIKVEIEEENLKKGYERFKEEVYEQVVSEYSDKELEKAWIEISREDFFSRIFYVHGMHSDLWRQTTQPKKISTHLFYKGKIFHTIETHNKIHGPSTSIHPLDKTKELIKDLEQ